MENKNLRIVFYGSPSFAVPTLEKLIELDFNVVLVITGNGETPVKKTADRLLIPTYLPGDLKRNTEEVVRILDYYKPNLGIVMAYDILPEDIYRYPDIGTFCIHPSLLPEYRGVAPINWAIINGERTTGLTSFWVDSGIDTGPIISCLHYMINPYYNFGKIYKDMSEMMAPSLCIETLQTIMNGDAIRRAQITTGKEMKAPKLTRENCWIDWGMKAREVVDFVRGLSPKPGALSLIYGQEYKILEAEVEYRMVSNQTIEPGTEFVVGSSLYIMTYNCWVEIIKLWKEGCEKPISAKEFVEEWRLGR